MEIQIQMQKTFGPVLVIVMLRGVILIAKMNEVLVTYVSGSLGSWCKVKCDNDEDSTPQLLDLLQYGRI